MHGAFLVDYDFKENVDAYSLSSKNGTSVIVRSIRRDSKEKNEYTVVFETHTSAGEKKYMQGRITFVEDFDLKDFSRERDITGGKFREISRELSLYLLFGKDAELSVTRGY